MFINLSIVRFSELLHLAVPYTAENGHALSHEQYFSKQPFLDICWYAFKQAAVNARWWEKYLSKRSPLKLTCSWHDKLIILWILNRQAKISLCIGNTIFYFQPIKTYNKEGWHCLQSFINYKYFLKFTCSVSWRNKTLLWAYQKVLDTPNIDPNELEHTLYQSSSIWINTGHILFSSL